MRCPTQMTCARSRCHSQGWSKLQALLRGEPNLFFTAPEYDNAPLVMVRLANVDRVRIEELICDAWQMRLDLGS